MTTDAAFAHLALVLRTANRTAANRLAGANAVTHAFTYLDSLRAEVERLREDVARCAADTTAAELRQRIEFVRTVLDRHAEINAARDHPEQQVYDLISEVRYQLEPRE